MSSPPSSSTDSALPPAPPRSSSRRMNGGSAYSGRDPNATAGGHAGSPYAVAPFYPANDAQTYRDLLIFEERLKQNAARLVKRKKKYQTFLVLLCGAIGLFSYYVFVQPSTWQPLHYLNVTVLLITATMLLLFFASGMYAERITAANKFVPQANRSLRSFNMYLNTRTAPRRSFFSFLRSTPPRRTVLVQQAIEKDGDGTVPMQRVPSTGKSPSTVAAARRLHIPTIPPSSNPRGELIFSGKVSPQFREGYERYRAAFERRRSEKMDERRRSGWRRWWVFGDRGDGRRGAAASPAGLDANAAERGVVMSTRSSPAPSLRSSVRSSPRKGRPRLNAMAQSGSETSSPAGSRGSSPNATPTIHNEPTMVAGPPSSTDSFKRGRRSSMRDQGIGADPGDGEGSAQGERRGRDRTPSITAVSDERLRRHSVNVMDKQPVGAEVTSDVIAEEASTDAADAAAAAAQLGSLSTPDPALVADQADNRAEVEATLREPAT